MFDSSLPPVVCKGIMSYLRYLCLFAHSVVQHKLCCVFALFVFVLCLVYHILPVCLDCPFLIANSVFSNVYLNHNTFTLVYIISKRLQKVISRTS
jgi:hypothetical protein